MKSIVLDTNCLLMCFSKKSKYHAVWTAFTIQVNPYFNWNFIRADPDDNKFIDCAIAANADCIVSQDEHFNILKEIDFPKINVIKIEDFVKLIEEI